MFSDLFTCFFSVSFSHSVLHIFSFSSPLRRVHECVCCVSLWTNEMNLSRVPLILSTFIVEKHFTCAATYFKSGDRKINPLIHFASHSLTHTHTYSLRVCVSFTCFFFLFFFVFSVRTIITGLVQVSDEIDFLFSAQSHFVLPLSLCKCLAFLCLFYSLYIHFISYHSKWFLLI